MPLHVRNWSTFSLIHTKRRNRLLPAHTEKLVYIHTNLRLISKIKERGYERMEVTLEMLNKEKDEERLLALQEIQEAIAETAFDEIEPIPLTSSSHIGTSTSVGLDDEDEEDDDNEANDEATDDAIAEDVSYSES